MGLLLDMSPRTLEKYCILPLMLLLIRDKRHIKETSSNERNKDSVKSWEVTLELV